MSICSPSVSDAGSSQYWYLNNLLAIDSCHPIMESPYTQDLGRIATPLKTDKWEETVGSHHDRLFVKYMLTDIREGFCIVFDYNSFANKLRPNSKNMHSAYENPSVVNKYITEELIAECISPVKQQQPGALPMLVHSSPFGVIPKKSSPGKWRLIIDLSSPSEGSVNDGIASPQCSLSYPTVHEAARPFLAS